MTHDRKDRRSDSLRVFMIVDKIGSKTGHWHDIADAVVKGSIDLDKGGLRDTPGVPYCMWHAIEGRRSLEDAHKIGSSRCHLHDYAAQTLSSKMPPIKSA